MHFSLPSFRTCACCARPPSSNLNQTQLHVHSRDITSSADPETSPSEFRAESQYQRTRYVTLSPSEIKTCCGCPDIFPPTRPPPTSPRPGPHIFPPSANSPVSAFPSPHRTSPRSFSTFTSNSPAVTCPFASKRCTKRYPCCRRSRRIQAHAARESLAYFASSILNLWRYRH